MSKLIEIEDADGTSSWSFKTDNEPLTQLDRQIALDGVHRIVDVQGPLNICALVRVKEGASHFLRDNEYFSTPNECVMFVPAYSVIEWSFQNVRSEIIAAVTSIPCFDYGREPLLLRRLSFQNLPRTLKEFHALAEAICTSEGAVAIGRSSKPTSLSRKVKMAVDKNFGDDVKISELAKNLSTSPSVVSRQFKADYGLSPAEYRKRVRMIAASLLLVNGEDIIRTSGAVGYSDLSGFYKHFRQIATVAPAYFAGRKSKKTKK